ncbi:MAG: DUF58 domain-containing protein [Candidatus Nanohaloarchaea archaeon]
MLGFENDGDGLDEDDLVEPAKLRKQVDAEVKRVSDLFRFILKYKEHFQPSGVEFSGLREYLPSDDANRIDWKISAGKPDLYVKQYDEDRDMDVFIILDVSETMLFGTADKLKIEYAAVVASALAYASVEAGINVGIGIWGEETRIVTPQGGDEQYQRILHEVTKYERYGGKFDLEDAMNDTIGQIQDNTAIFIISDFLDVEGEWKSKMQLANEKFRHQMAVMVRDLRDYKLPESGNFRFESPQGDQIVVNTNRAKEEFDREAQQQMEQMENKLTGAGASFLKIDTRDEFAGSFAEYFDQEEGGW